MAVFRTFFLGRSLGASERACAASFAAHGHSLRLYAYEPLDVPASVEVADAATVISRAERDAFFETAPGRVSQFSNGFRYRLLKEQGGWWVDTDVMCRSEQVPAGELVLGREHDDFVGTAILRFPPDHPLLIEAEKVWRESWSVDTWAFTGPQLMSRLVRDFGLDQHVTSQRDLYPVAWPQALDLFDPSRRADVERVIEGRPFLHVWLSMLPRVGLPRDSIPPSGSALRVLIDRYLQTEGCPAEGTFINDALVSLSNFKRVAEQSDREARHAKKVAELAINDVALARAHGERLTLELDDAKAWVRKLSGQLDEAMVEHERLKAAYAAMPSLALRIARKFGLGRLKRYIGNT
jgi:hypothetical protein